MKLRQSWSLVGLLAILVALGIVSAVVLMQQTEPSVPVSGSMTRNCEPTAATPANVTLGGSGQITVSGSSASPTTTPAFPTGGPAPVTPTCTGLNAAFYATGLF